MRTLSMMTVIAALLIAAPAQAKETGNAELTKARCSAHVRDLAIIGFSLLAADDFSTLIYFIQELAKEPDIAEAWVATNRKSVWVAHSDQTKVPKPVDGPDKALLAIDKEQCKQETWKGKPTMACSAPIWDEKRHAATLLVRCKLE